MFQCAFCRVTSYLQSDGPFRYLLPSSAPEDKDLLYIPYWRLKGMLFSCSLHDVTHRIVDVSQQAIDSTLFPPSVGLRSQALRLKFATADSRGHFIPPTLPIEGIKEMLDKRFSPFFPKPVIHQTYIGDTLSMIYAPYYVERKLFDAVLNQPVSADLPEDSEVYAFTGQQPDWSIRFLPTLCPHCGWDMQGQRDALLLTCDNCESVWKSTQKGFAKLNASYMPDDGEDLLYMPFWRIRADIKGLTLDSLADLIRAANLPKAVQPGMENIQFHFWSLAFKVRPQNFLQLSRAVTLSQPAQKLLPGPPPARKHPVTLPLQEAVESLKMTLAGFLKPRRKMMELMPDITITPKSFILVYLPFHETQHEFIQRKFTLTLHKNLLLHARNL